ncbi:hypothetical protein OROGR_013381 [Orobanche gracilis]
MLMTTLLQQFVFSITVCGDIREWLFDNNGSRVDYDAPCVREWRTGLAIKDFWLLASSIC